MAFGAEDVQAAEADDLLVIALPLFADLLLDLFALGRIGDVLRLLIGQELRVAAEKDVRAAAGHVRGDGDSGLVARLGHDFRLALVMFGIEHDVRHALPLEHRREQL